MDDDCAQINHYSLRIVSIAIKGLKLISKMDTYFTYYHCISNPSLIGRYYTCKRFNDPLKIPYTPDSFIIPVHTWIPDFYHTQYVRKQIQKWDKYEVDLQT